MGHVNGEFPGAGLVYPKGEEKLPFGERENREQFQGFYRTLYELKLAELASTQMILIDKEYSPPPADLELPVKSRQMRPKDPVCPPLIPYYQGGE